jgi:cytochrome oxidase Cu insertion factor (SCO1/SenC/PrrC family)
MSADPNSSTPPQREETELPSSSAGSTLPCFLCFIVVFAMVYGGWKWWQVWQYDQAGGEAIPAGVIGPPLKEFQLTERSGKPFRSREMRGHVWVATYFFTSCPGQCLRLNANIQVLNADQTLKDVTWVSISCDPDTDTLEALRTYADRFQADPQRWLFCRGDLDYVKRVAKGMDLYLSLKGHQDVAIVIDKNGKMRGTFDGTSESQCNRLRARLLECLAEKPATDMVAAGKANGKSS